MKRDIGSTRVAINGRFLTQPATGVQRYAYELVRAWDEMLGEGEIDPGRYAIELLAPRLESSAPSLECIPVRQVGRLAGNLWEQIDLPWSARGHLLFDPCNIGPVIKPGQAVTLHDASIFAVPDSYSLGFRSKYRLVLSILARTARVILTDSFFSKNELVRYCHVDQRRVQVVPLGCDHITRAQPDEGVFQKNKIGQKPFLLAVGSNAPHKNLGRLCQAVNLLRDSNLELVIAGGTFTRVFQATGLAQSEKIKPLDYVSEGELKALYQRATALVFPSLYEGFGLPPLEAMACGCPVMVARTAALPEVCGDAALYFNPESAQDLADKIALFVPDAGLQANLRALGLLRAAKYTWRDTARRTWDILTAG